MWANTPPDGGLIVVGQNDVSDGGDFEGLEARGARVNEIEKSPKRLCGDARVEQRRVEVTNQHGKNDFVLLIRVHFNEEKVVRTNKGEAFQRWGDEKHQLNELEILELEADRGQLHPEQQDAVISYPEGYNELEIATFSATIKKVRRLEPGHSDEDILQIMNLGRFASDGSFIPNVACALLFAKSPLDVVPGCRIRFQRFDGVEQHTGSSYNVVKDEEITGPVPRMIEGAARVIESQVREFSSLDENGKFYTVPEYPRDAWYEAVVNACAHRSYGNGLKNAQIFVRMFDDRLEVESPGGFPPLVTPENLFHNPRNPFLMHALRHLEYVKCASEGTARMRELMAEMSLPDPEFVQKAGGGASVLVTLRNNLAERRPWVDRDIEAMIGSAVAGKLDEDERQCLNFIAMNGEMSVTDGQKVTGRSWEKVKKVLTGLVKRDILERDARFKRDPKGRYRLKAEYRPSGHDFSAS